MNLKNISLNLILKKSIYNYRQNLLKDDFKENSYEYFLKLIRHLHIFYSSLDDLFLDSNRSRDVYEGLVILLQSCNNIEFTYLYGNLSILN